MLYDIFITSIDIIYRRNYTYKELTGIEILNKN